MPFDWREFHNLAINLSKNSDEASLRSSVSRAYYAAFHLARDFAKNCLSFQPTYKGPDHDGVVNHMKNHNDKAVRAIGINLDRLKDNRRIADYVSNTRVKPNLVALSIGFGDNVENGIKDWTP